MNATELRIPITGMTCAACANRIERKLNKVEGVEASVNYATENATIAFDPSLVTPAALVETIESIGYGATLPSSEPSATGPTADPLASLRQRFIGSLILGIPVLVLSMVPAFEFRNWQWLCFALAAPVATWGAWPFHHTAAKNLRFASTTMDTLVSVGVIAAFGWSTWALFFTDVGMTGMRMGHAGMPHLYLETASVVVALILAGRYFEARAKHRAGDALRSLLEVGAKEAMVLAADGTERRTPVSQLAVGDRFVVRPGEKIATDGIVEAGASAVDQSVVTGESVPVEVGPGDSVVGASINAGGRLVVQATRVGAQTHLAQIARLVEEAQSGKAPVQRLADRVSAVFVPVVIALAIATFAFWWWHTRTVSEAFRNSIAVLIIACPCALGLATPTALLVGTGRGAKIGILIRGPEVLESTRRVDTVVLDKTGTITTGHMAVIARTTDDEAFALAAAVEAASEHPIARAIVAAAGDPVQPVTEFHATAGVGVAGVVNDHRVAVERTAGEGATVVRVVVDGVERGTISVADTVKPTSAAAIAELRALGLRPVLATGDNASVAAAVAKIVGIDDVRAGVMPADKVSLVKALQAEGRVVAMVGDGVNDAAALAQADLGISMASGTDAAINASDLTLVRNDLASVADAIHLSRRTLTTIKGNLFWAFAYNVAAIPLAMAGALSPTIAGAAMAFSSVFVVSNSLRLRRG